MSAARPRSLDLRKSGRNKLCTFLNRVKSVELQQLHHYPSNGGARFDSAFDESEMVSPAIAPWMKERDDRAAHGRGAKCEYLLRRRQPG